MDKKCKIFSNKGGKMTDQEFEERVLKFDQRNDLIRQALLDLKNLKQRAVFGDISKTPKELIKEAQKC